MKKTESIFIEIEISKPKVCRKRRIIQMLPEDKVWRCPRSGVYLNYDSAKDMTVDELRYELILNVRGYNRLKEHGVKVFKEIIDLGWDGLLEIPGIGWGTRLAIADRIEKYTGVRIKKD